MDKLNELIDRINSFTGGHASVLVTFLKALVAVGVVYIVWLIIKRILDSMQVRFQNVTFFQRNKDLFPTATKSMRLLLLLIVGILLIRLFNLNMLEKPFQALFIILFAIPANKILLMLLTYLENNMVNKTATVIDDIIFDLLNKFAGVIIYSTAVVLALDILGINVMPFVAGAGILGVAIGFAAKDTLSNLIAGVLLIIDRPFEIGDRIEVWSSPSGSASWGDVIDIGLRATKIKTTDNIVCVIPNNEIMKRDIINYTHITADIRVRINIGVSYESDIDKAKKAIIEVARELDWVLDQPSPKVVVRNFGDSSVDLQLRVWIRDARKRMDTISHVTDRVKTAFDREGIEIPYPKRDITIINQSQ
jgi:small-conductance mechanosensitive channel